MRTSDFDSDETFGKVVEKLGLVQRWKKETAADAVEEMKKAVIVQSRRRTDVLEIKVVDDDPELAADIAQCIYDVVLESVTSLKDAEDRKYLAVLDEQISEQRVRVSEAKATLDTATSEQAQSASAEELMGEYRIEQNKLKAHAHKYSRKQFEHTNSLRPMTILEAPVPATVRRLW